MRRDPPAQASENASKSDAAFELDDINGLWCDVLSALNGETKKRAQRITCGGVHGSFLVLEAMRFGSGWGTVMLEKQPGCLAS